MQTVRFSAHTSFQVADDTDIEDLYLEVNPFTGVFELKQYGKTLTERGVVIARSIPNDSEPGSKPTLEFDIELTEVDRSR